MRNILPGGQKDALSDSATADLKSTFKSRYHSFKLLLASNNKALEAMAGMEQALSGDKPFGMSFVQGHCTALLVNVFQMVKHLDELAPTQGKYVVLYERLREIQQRVNGLLVRKTPHDQGPLVVPLEEVDKEWTDQAGLKMTNLGHMKNHLNIPVPAGFVITAAAFFRFFKHNQLQEEINRRVQSASLERTDQLFALSSGIQQLVVRSKLPADLSQAISRAYRELEGETKQGITVSVRSSAIGEDSPGTSFAGQYISQLNVRPENIEQAYKEVVASKYTPQAMQYRLLRGLRDRDIAMCVGVLAMVDAKAGGVAYSQNALDLSDRNVLISSTWGLPKSVVDGDTEADIFVVERSEPLWVKERKIAHKESQFICYPDEGVCRLDLTGQDQADIPSLTDQQVESLAQTALRLEKYYGFPQDVEWALDQNGDLVFLQSRALQRAKPEEEQPQEEAKSPHAEIPKALLGGGVKASPGAASGTVFWVRKNSDALLFPEGAVLAVPQPIPRWAALLGRASAVVAQHGSQTGHLATVARELRVPALFGLEQAEGILKNGQVVTVDADQLAIYEGRRESVLTRTKKKKNLMAGSPVYVTLENVLQHIAPLTLVDPDAPSFAAQNCQTLHDITRFCHEKSVHEMFSFGKDHHFPQHSSKQLFYKVPMQYWIINLDDGFHEEVGDKYVKLENIACLPMLAVWQGMIAVPWEGPPAVSGRGLASVLFQATANPALGTPFKSPYSNRNYFMISKNFMNLQSRFGFHFCAVESLVSERLHENYISFSFKGGAADAERKIARVQFLKNILEDYGFRVELNDDTALARLEGLDAEEMKNRLKVLGYLIMHTRQLDMIMGRPSSVKYYRNKIDKDLKGMLEKPAEAS